MNSEARIFNPRRLGHVNLIVDDLERSMRFYTDVCGLTLEFSEPGLKAGFMGTGHTPHDLGMIERTREDRYGKDGHLQIPKGALDGVTLNHIAWEMDTEADLVAGYERAARAGVQTGRTSDHQIAHSVYMKDPDGNVVEFYADMVQDWRSVLHGEMDLITSVWKPGDAAPETDPRWDPSPTVRRVESADLHPQRLSHVVLTTTNLPRAADFYATVGGLRPIHASDRFVLMKGSHECGAYHLAVVASDRDGLHHFGFELGTPSGLTTAAAALRRRGLTIARSQDGLLKTSVFITDPDGFLVEFCRAKNGTFEEAESCDSETLPFLL
jgi:catechol 2,3-dioxygenase